MGFFVVIRGPLGIGKTTVAERLARVVGGDYVSIDRILSEHDLEQWEDGYISVASFVRANTFAIEAARTALDAGTPVVVDGNFYWEPQVEDLIDRLRFPHQVFTLKAPIEVCLQRDRGRAHSLGETAVREVYAISTRFDWGIAIDATGPLDDVVAEIVAHLRTYPGLRGSRHRAPTRPGRGPRRRTGGAGPARRSVRRSPRR